MSANQTLSKVRKIQQKVEAKTQRETLLELRISIFCCTYLFHLNLNVKRKKPKLTGELTDHSNPPKDAVVSEAESRTHHCYPVDKTRVGETPLHIRVIRIYIHVKSTTQLFPLTF